MTNEAFARVKIDALLAAQGWNTQDPNAVRYEVVLPDSTRADYVLCDRHGRSLAVIEAKRFSVSPGDAAAQAKTYAQHQIGIIKRVFGFQKVRYRGLAKSLHRLEVTAALADLFMARRRLLDARA